MLTAEHYHMHSVAEENYNDTLYPNIISLITLPGFYSSFSYLAIATAINQQKQLSI